MRLLNGSLRAGVVGLLAIGAIAAGCGSDDDESGAAADATTAPVELAEVTLAMGPLADAVPIELGIKHGFFEEESIDVKVNTDLTYAQSPGAVVAGQVDFAQHSWGSTVAFAANGLPLVTVAQLSTSGETVDDDGVLFVTLADSGIESAADVKGKRLGLASLGGLSELGAITFAKTGGLTRDDVKLAAVPFPTMGAALRSKRIDVALISEPYYTQLAGEADLKVLSAGNALLMPHLPLVNIFTSREKLEKDPDVVERFGRAVTKSVAYAAEHPDEVRAALPAFSKVDESLTSKMRLPVYSSAIEIDKVQKLSEMLHEAGLTPKVIEATDVAPAGS